MPRAAHDFLPRKDAEFRSWIEQYYNEFEAWWTAQGYDQQTIDELKDARNTFLDAFAAHVAAIAAADSAREAKDQARSSLEALVRPLTRRVQTDPAMTDATRALLGIALPPGPATPAGVPRTAPQATATPVARLTHELRLVDAGSPTRRKKPAGVLGAEVWVRLVEPGIRDSALGIRAPGSDTNAESRVPNAAASPPTGHSPLASSPSPLPIAHSPLASFAFLTLTTRTTLRTDFRAQDGGKTAIYMARWVNTRGEKGPWSEITTATVAA